MTRNTPLSIALVVIGLLASGCGDDPSDGQATDRGSEPGLGGAITVSAAASLTDAFTEIGDDFTAAHPAADVAFNFDSSSTLSAQILAGAPADVYASADEVNMVELVDDGLLAGEPQVFARNELVIVTEPGNPAGITGLADLADVGVTSLCGEDVPCGRFAARALERAAVSIPETDVTRGQNVRATLTAVTEGDAVAAIVYATDAISAGDNVDAVAVPEGQDVVATYPIGVLADTADAELADAFVAYVLDEGQAVLGALGFLPPG